MQHWFPAKSNIGQQISNIGPLKFPMLDKVFPTLSSCTIQHWIIENCNMGFMRNPRLDNRFPTLEQNTEISLSCTMDFSLVSHVARWNFQSWDMPHSNILSPFSGIQDCINLIIKKSLERQVSKD